MKTENLSLRVEMQDMSLASEVMLSKSTEDYLFIIEISVFG